MRTLAHKWSLLSGLSASLLLTAWLGFGTPALATDSCWPYYQQNKFPAAGNCYELKALRITSDTRLSRIQRALKGKSLRRAASAFAKAAKRTLRPDHRAYFYEKATKMLDIYLEKRLCLRSYRCLIARGQRAKFRGLVGYTWLTIITQPNTNATIQLHGFRTRLKLKISKFNRNRTRRELRPGKYKVSVSYPQKPPLIRFLVLPPDGDVDLSMLQQHTPKPLKPPTQTPASPPINWPLIGWITTAAGGVAIATGAVFLGLGYESTGRINRWRDLGLKRSPQDAQLMSEELSAKDARLQYQAGTQQVALGWLFAGPGIALSTAGLFLVLAPLNPPKTTKK